MYTWTSRAAGIALFALAGCAAPVDVARLAPQSVVVAENVRVSGPPGYCIDPSALRETGAATFVLMGSCASLSRGGMDAMPEAPAVLTVLVAREGGAALSQSSGAQLARFFESEPGRAALSPDGRAESVEVIETRTGTGQVFVRARDLTRSRPVNLDDEYWRALIDLDGRLVTATLIGFEATPLAPQDGLRTISALATRLVSENRAGLRE